jgi:hypothetical protein
MSAPSNQSDLGSLEIRHQIPDVFPTDPDRPYQEGSGVAKQWEIRKTLACRIARWR